MTWAFRRQLYRYLLASFTCCLLGILVFDVEDFGIAANEMAWFCYLLTFVGIMLAFKALDTWSSWLEDTSEDADDDQPRRNPYPMIFALQAGAVLLLATFLLITAMVRGWPNGQEGLICFWSLIVAGACLLVSKLSEGLD